MNIKNKARSKHRTLNKSEKFGKNFSNTYMMHGKHPVLAAVKNKNRIIKNIYCLGKIYDQYKDQLLDKNVKIVDSEFLRNLVGEDITHQGIVANVEKLPKLPHQEIISDNTRKDRIVILDQITDPQNIGAIIRSAAAFGINKIILPENGSPEENATIAKAASGCLELVSFTKVTNISKFLALLKKSGYWIVGLDGKGKDDINKVAEIDKLAIIIGSEGKGIRRLTTENCDFIVKIPMANNVESLNASCAASIILYACSNL